MSFSAFIRVSSSSKGEVDKKSVKQWHKTLIYRGTWRTCHLDFLTGPHCNQREATRWMPEYARVHLAAGQQKAIGDGSYMAAYRAEYMDWSKKGCGTENSLGVTEESRVSSKIVATFARCTSRSYWEPAMDHRRRQKTSPKIIQLFGCIEFWGRPLKNAFPVDFWLISVNVQSAGQPCSTWHVILQVCT